MLEEVGSASVRGLPFAQAVEVCRSSARPLHLGFRDEWGGAAVADLSGTWEATGQATGATRLLLHSDGNEDESTGAIYFFNVQTGETTWDLEEVVARSVEAGGGA